MNISTSMYHRSVAWKYQAIGSGEWRVTLNKEWAASLGTPAIPLMEAAPAIQRLQDERAALSPAAIHRITIREAQKIGGPLVDEVPADDLTALGRAIVECAITRKGGAT